MNYDTLKPQIINMININSFNKLNKDYNNGNPVPKATRHFYLKSGDSMQKKKKKVIIMLSLSGMQLTHQFQLTQNTKTCSSVNLLCMYMPWNDSPNLYIIID